MKALVLDNGATFYFASDYRELRGQQLGMMAIWHDGPQRPYLYWLMQLLTHPDDAPTLRGQLVMFWQQIRLAWAWQGSRYYSRLARWLFPIRFDEDTFDELCSMADWLFETPYTDTTNRLPQIAGLHGPSDQLRSLSYAQFYNAETFYLLYHRTRDAKWLAYLTAVLYMFKGEAWSDEDDPELDERVAFVSRAIRRSEQAYVLLFYTACRDYIHSRYPLIFPKPTERQEPARPARPANPRVVRDQWRIDIRSIVGKDFVNMARVDRSPLYRVLDHIQHTIHEAEKEASRQRMATLKTT